MDEPAAAAARSTSCAAPDVVSSSVAYDLAQTLADLRGGSFSALAPCFADPESPLRGWIASGALDDEALAEALTCASFNGDVAIVELLLGLGVPPNGGRATGLDALHWAANRGQPTVVRLLINAGADLETRSMYDGTALGTAVWSAIHEPRGDQLAVIAALLAAGAHRAEVELPTGDARVNALFA